MFVHRFAFLFTCCLLVTSNTHAVYPSNLQEILDRNLPVTLSKLNLDGISLDNRAMERLENLVRRSDELQVFDLGNQVLGPYWGGKILEAMPTSLRCLNLSDSRIFYPTPQNFSLLGRLGNWMLWSLYAWLQPDPTKSNLGILRRFSRLKTIDLSDHDIGGNADVSAGVLSSFQDLQVLKLRNTNLETLGAERIFEALLQSGSTHIKTFDLRGNSSGNWTEETIGLPLLRGVFLKNHRTCWRILVNEEVEEALRTDICTLLESQSRQPAANLRRVLRAINPPS